MCSTDRNSDHDTYNTELHTVLSINCAEDFDVIAWKILNETHLVAGRSRFRIIEIEFYLRSADHPDPYVHCANEQLSVGQWYFHKAGASYRGGTFKGLDITFGKGAYGGVLIRSMVADDGTVIEGPCNCVNRLLAATGHQTVKSLATSVDCSIYTGLLTLVESAPLTLPIYTSARVGLNLDRSPMFANLPYRHITDIKNIKKQRKTIISGLRNFHGFTAADIKALGISVRGAD